MSSQANPRRRVSVIVPTRDRPDFLRQALDSIRALELAGEDLEFEIIVCDNGSDPKTAETAREFGAVYRQTSTNGAPAARNLGLAIASGEFIAFLDDDDVWLEGNIRPHIALMDANPEFEAAFGRIQYGDEHLEPFGEPWPSKADWPENNDVYLTMLDGYFPQVGASVVRKRVVDVYGLMDEKLIGDACWDWQMRIASNHPIGFVNQPCVLCRSRPKSSYDKLQLMRAGYTRRIFRHHAIRNISRWPSPLAMLKSYYSSVTHYYDYFVSSAAERAEAGDRKGARAASLYALRTNPFRAVRSMTKPSKLRHAVRLAFLSQDRGSNGQAEHSR